MHFCYNYPLNSILLNPRPEVSDMPHVLHPFLKDGVEARAYQIRSLKKALNSSTLMVMPTGFGKTAVQWMVMADFLSRSDGKILLIAPTTGLVEQQHRMATEMIDIDADEVVIYTGDTAPVKRPNLWESARIIMATPQVIRNDASSNRISLRDVCLLIFDEAHHATGNHAYAQVGDIYLEQNKSGYVLAATASPGSTENSILEVLRRLGIDYLDISRRGEFLLEPYTVELNNEVLNLELPAKITELLNPLVNYNNSEIESLQRMGYLAPVKHITTKIINDAQKSVSRAINRRDVRAYDAARRISDLRRMQMLLNLIRSQGINPALSYLDKAEEDGRTGGRGTNRFIANPAVHNFRTECRRIGDIHPKPSVVKNMVIERISQNEQSRIIIFTEYRYSVDSLISILSSIENIRAGKFIGQSTKGKDKGMTQKQQIERLREFREGEINVLVATSVGEEGLDVPAADLVLMYEPVPSAIRSIQRRGRTARQSSGTVKTLVMKGSRDEYVLGSAKRNEEKMYRILDELHKKGRLPTKIPTNNDSLSRFKINENGNIISADEFLSAEIERLSPSEEEQEIIQETTQKTPEVARVAPIIEAKDKRPSNQMGLDSFIVRDSPIENDRNKIIASSNAAEKIVDEALTNISQEVILDHREASSTLAAYLRSMGAIVSFENLLVGDIKLSGGITIERKTARDLLTSIVDGRLFKQCVKLIDSADRPLLLIELGEVGNFVHPNAVLGALAHITIDLGIPTMMTKDTTETAYFVSLIAKDPSRLKSKIKQYCKYADVNLDDVQSKIDAAQSEITAMIRGEDSGDFYLSAWSKKVFSYHCELLSDITGIELSSCVDLMSEHKTIAQVIQLERLELLKYISKSDYENMLKLFIAG